MSRLTRRIRDCVVLATVFCCMQVFPPCLSADESAVKMVKLDGAIDRTESEPIHPFALSGIASHLGRFTAVGEVAFVSGEQPDSETGTGVVVFASANGDQLVGVVAFDLAASENDTHDTSIHFAWRDSVTFSNGTVARNTGRFVRDRPPGLVVIGQTVCVRIPFTNRYICTIVYR
ncbi:MAG: hypothetical protein JNJ77_20930 [Planctomycetia bacterium]|nr:hypothetical protein [Planctomycetia bacterium]